MKKLLLMGVALLCSVSMYGQGTKERLTGHVYALAADSMSGRKFGEPSALKAAEYVAAQFAEAGIEPYMDSTYFQPFNAGEKIGFNVVGVLRGNDPALRDEWIILGAHFDHLGKKESGEIYHGADDNASGTAVLVETARALAERRGELSRSVMFVAFDGEEAGLWGSRHLADNLPEGKVKLMASLDMVGWLKESGRLKIAGVAMLKNGKTLFREGNPADGAQVPLELKNLDTFLMGSSDHEPFARQGIPAMHITTGTKSPYHKPEDTADKIDYEGMTRITGYMTDVTVGAATAGELQPSGKRSFKHGGEPEPLFMAGVNASVGSNFHHYKDGALEGKTAFAWSAGLWAQINFGNFALRPKVLYEQRNAQWPLDFVSRTSTRFHTEGLSVPVDLMFKLRGKKRSSTYLYVFAGGYYSTVFSGKTGDNKIEFGSSGRGFHRDEWGWQWGAGLNIYKVYIEGVDRYGISGLMSEGGKITNRASYFSIGYRF